MNNEFPTVEVAGTKEAVTNGPEKEEDEDKAKDTNTNANTDEENKVILMWISRSNTVS